MSSPPKHDQPRSFAFFDLDQTLVPYDMQLLFGNWIIKHHPHRRIYLLFFLLTLPFRSLIGTTRVKRVYLSLLHGMSEKDVRTCCQSFVDHYLPDLIYPEVRERLIAHQTAGDCVILTSASPLLYVQLIGEHLNVNKTFGTQVIVEPKMKLVPDFVGTNNKSEEKIRRLEEWFRAKGWTWNPPFLGSVSYTDSQADLPLLQIAESAVLIHPSEELKENTKKSHSKNHTILYPRKFRKNKLVTNSILMFFGLFSLRERRIS